ncbi:MAG: ROK family protein [Candidatus Handelsmanbacteria bacterium]|nr:ROK family protein [Candidatus Handelsmanbacteria bacterium]
MAVHWGIDLGGTKIEGVVLADGEAEPRCRLRLPTEQEQGYRHIVGQIHRLVEQMAAQTGLQPAAIGVGTPGVLDPQTQTLKNSNTLCLNGQPLKADLEQALGVPLELANDANCFALAEARLGAGKGAETVFGIIMGTGVGGGVVVRERVLYGCQGIAGEWGHNVLDPEGPECYCGKRGCVEKFLAGPALREYYAGLAGAALPLPEIAQRCERDPHAAATMQRLTAYFGRAIAYLINILDPHVIVIGGGVSNVELLYTAGLRAAAPYVFNNRLETRVVKNQLGDSAGVFGAAMLVA